MAEKLFEILVPTNDSFLVYPFAQKIYQSSGYQISYDDKKPDHEARIFYDENYVEASKWKLGSSELNTFYYDKKLNMIVVDKQGQKVGEYKLKNGVLTESWGNKGILLIKNRINPCLFYVDFQEFIPVNLDKDFNTSIRELHDGTMACQKFVQKLMTYAKLSINLRAQVDLVRLLVDLGHETLIYHHWPYLTNFATPQEFLNHISSSEYANNQKIQLIQSQIKNSIKPRIFKTKKPATQVINKKEESKNCNLI